MNSTIEVWLVVVFTILAVGGVYLMLGNTIRDSIKNLIQSSPCENFFSRVFMLALVFTGLIGILETNPHLLIGNSDGVVDRTFMESVWISVDRLTETFWLMLLVMFIYLLVITILTAVLNRRKA